LLRIGAIALALALSVPGLCAAQGFLQKGKPVSVPQHVVFAGVGPAKRGDPSTSDGTPWSLGYLYRAANSKVYWGIDVAGEGTSLNNTSGNVNVVEQGLSFNLLVGRTLNLGSHWRAGAGVLAGIRLTGKSCPDSYLGYQCYADEEPKEDYAFNYGAMLHLSFEKVLIGARASGESLQVMFGIAF
jgi:hypothetical protein